MLIRISKSDWEKVGLVNYPRLKSWVSEPIILDDLIRQKAEEEEKKKRELGIVAENKKVVKISKSVWENIGKKYGWL